MPSAKWEDMKQMKRLTNRHIVKIIMWSLPVAILAAIAFISLPSFLPKGQDGMAGSVVAVECREYYEITASGKIMAVCREIKNDSTLGTVKEKADSDTEQKAMVCGTWINKYSFLPSCQGRIFTVNPFFQETDMLPTANKNIYAFIEKSITQSEEALSLGDKKQKELEYYLNTHSVKDEGYNTMAAYTDENKKKNAMLEKSIEILKKLKEQKNIRVRKKCRYTLLYSEDGKKTCRILCNTMGEESKKHDKGTIILQTNGNFMPEKSNSVYSFNVFSVVPERNDSVTAAGLFGLNKRSTVKIALQKANTFRGKALAADRHDIPQLLTPDGAPVFNKNGFFIGLNHNGRIVR